MRVATFVELDDGRIVSVMIPPEVMGPVTLTIAQAITAFNSFLPDIAEIRRANAHLDTETAADIRTAEVSASLLVIGVGALLSGLTQNKWPFIVALLLSLFLTAMYEYILTGRPFSNA